MALLEYLRRVFPGSLEAFAQRAEEALRGGGKMFIVTANPEILTHGEADEEVRALLLDPATAVTPDGISVVRAMRSAGLPVTERITGVDLAQRFLDAAGQAGKRVYLLGAKEEVVSALAGKLRAAYPDAQVRYTNGYVPDKDAVFPEILAFDPDLVLVALGVPAQERLLYRHLGEFSHGVFMGVGGSFDVLSGSKRRAPALFVRTNTEWLYRILREPSRLGRFWRNNVRFLGRVRKEIRG